jgi:hypothetical protein
VDHLQANKLLYFPMQPALTAATSGLYKDVRIVLVSRSDKLMSIGRAHLLVQSLIKQDAVIQPTFNHTSSHGSVSHVVALSDNTVNKAWSFNEVAEALGVAREMLLHCCTPRPGVRPIRIVRDSWIGTCNTANALVRLQLFFAADQLTARRCPKGFTRSSQRS